MKTRLFFMPLLAALAFTSCSNEDVVNSEDVFDGKFDGQAYMRVRISMPDDATTRAPEDPIFKNGTVEEQTIKEIGIKFYNADGSFYGYGLPVENPTVEMQSPDGGNVEGKVTDAVIVLQINSNAPKPTHLVAYANCGDGWKQEGNEPNIDQIDKTLPHAYSTYEADGVEKKLFAMTSSNYRTSAATGLDTYQQGYQTPIAPDKFKPTEAEAKAENVPVEIYVERLAAKVNVATVGGMDPAEIENGGYKLKFHLDGYALGGINHESYIIKHISELWTNDVLWAGWNNADLRRCYWAWDINYNYDLNNPPALDYVSYNEVSDRLNGASTSGTMYTAENTITSPTVGTTTQEAAKASQENSLGRAATELNRYLYQPFVYVMGHYVVTKDGVELTGTTDPYLYEYAGKIFDQDNMATHMEQTIGSVLYNKTQTGEGVNDIYSGIDMYKEGLVEIGAYQKDINSDKDASLVCLQLAAKATDAELGKYFIKNPNVSEKAPDLYIPATRENVAPLLKQSETQAYGFKYDTVKKGYLAYFPVLIKHLNRNSTLGESARGYYGVVRNHCYNITINKITGLGIGIFDPTVDIIPKDKIKPLYLAAKFNVLSWRIVDQEVDL